MSDTEQLPDHKDVNFDDYAHQTCYVFKPAVEDLNDRPKKRRKIAHVEHKTSETFPLLCNGRESSERARIRQETLSRLWGQQQTRIDATISQLDEDALETIVTFVKEDGSHQTDGKLRTGLVISGSDTSFQAHLLNQWRTTQKSNTELVSELRSSSCPNLQTALKNIIKSTISEAVGQDGYQDYFNKHKRMIPMNFDLELLQVLVQEQNTAKVVISTLDVETFDTNILSELISTLCSWSDRIPFVLLLGIATTVELFELRLPKSILRLLDAKILMLSSAGDRLYENLVEAQTSKDYALFLGPAIVSVLHDLSQNQGTTTEGFVQVLRCAYMSHFFANPLSTLLGDTTTEESDTRALCEVIRSTKSFQKYCEQLLSQGKGALRQLHDLLDNDKTLLDEAAMAVGEGQRHLWNAFTALAALSDMYKQLMLKSDESTFQVYLRMSNHLDDLTTSEVFGKMISKFETLKSNELCNVLSALKDTTHAYFGTMEIVDVLRDLPETQSLQSIESSYDASLPLVSSTSTTSATKKKKPSSTIYKLSEAEQQHVQLVERLIELITTTTKSYSFDLSNTLLHEAFIFNSRQHLQSAFTPRPRFALERALSKPGDYLTCDCCSRDHISDDDDNHETHRSPPPTSLLYNLLQEAGTIINVRDLFDAFSSRLHQSPVPSAPLDTDNEDQQARQQERLALALFYRSLSELKALGMVKGSTSALTKKRALASNGGDGDRDGKIAGRRGYADIDFVAKTSWGGL